MVCVENGTCSNDTPFAHIILFFDKTALFTNCASLSLWLVSVITLITKGNNNYFAKKIVSINLWIIGIYTKLSCCMNHFNTKNYICKIFSFDNKHCIFNI